jgi:voltage-gated potassium channel
MSGIKKMFSGFSLFAKAYEATKHQIWVSIKVLLIVTLLFAVMMYIAENSANSEYSFFDALVWTFVKYVEDPADVTTSPVTILGQVIGTLVGVLGIAIFAVPAGLIGSGLMEAMEDERYEKTLNEYHRRLGKVFRRCSSKALRTYLNSLPDKGGEALAKLNFVPQYVPLSRLQIRQGLEFKEVFEVCERFPGFRLKNLADALSSQENPEDRFVVSLSPFNTTYGCCINRGSNVTIVCPVGYSEVGTGWFSFYMAKLGGFNYVCKDFEVDVDELDSYYNMSPEPLYNKKTRSQYSEKDKMELDVLEKKERNRRDFLADIKRFVKNENSWVVIVTEHAKNANNVIDFHFSANNKDLLQPTVKNVALFDEFYESFCRVMEGEYGLSSVKQTTRYPLPKNNLLYRLESEGVSCNSFVLRPSTKQMIFDENKLLIAFRIAETLSNKFDNGKGIEAKDVEDFATTGFGYKE